MATKEKLPAPLVPPDLDLRAYQYMPLDVKRLLSSDTLLCATGEEVRAALMLWAESWRQMPCSSLPNDDLALCRMTGYGRDMDGWLRVKKVALRGFVLCSDGRLYHRVVAEKAMESYVKYRVEYHRTSKARSKRHPAHVTEHVTEPVTEHVTEPVTEPVTEHVTEPVTEHVTDHRLRDLRINTHTIARTRGGKGTPDVVALSQAWWDRLSTHVEFRALTEEGLVNVLMSFPVEPTETNVQTVLDRAGDLAEGVALDRPRAFLRKALSALDVAERTKGEEAAGSAPAEVQGAPLGWGAEAARLERETNERWERLQEEKRKKATEKT